MSIANYIMDMTYEIILSFSHKHWTEHSHAITKQPPHFSYPHIHYIGYYNINDNKCVYSKFDYIQKQPWEA